MGLLDHGLVLARRRERRKLARGIVRYATAQRLMVHGLIERTAAGSYLLTEEGRAVFAALLERK